MIAAFADKDTARLFEGEPARRFPAEIWDRARLKLAQIHAASTLDFLTLPPSNRLEILKGNRKGQYSIRINQHWRICFVWKNGIASDVEIVDYH